MDLDLLSKLKTEVIDHSGIKITYLPTGFSVRCIATKFKHQNANICLEYIKSYLKGLTNATSSSTG